MSRSILLPVIISAVSHIVDDTVCLCWGGGGEVILCRHDSHCLFVVQQAEAT